MMKKTDTAECIFVETGGRIHVLEKKPTDLKAYHVTALLSELRAAREIINLARDAELWVEGKEPLADLIRKYDEAYR